VVLEETGQKVSISAFTDAHRTFTKVPIVTAATAYDDKVTGTTYILILGQSIYMADTPLVEWSGSEMVRLGSWVRFPPRGPVRLYW
jgi:hypothetical protein